MVKADKVTYKSGRKVLLQTLDIHIQEGECWGITGPNGSGKSLLGLILAGELEPTSGGIGKTGKVGYVSFERQQSILEEERLRDDSRFLDLDGAENPGRSVEEWVSEALDKEQKARVGSMISLMGLERVAGRGLRYLSTGEFRKTMLCRVLLEKADFLIFDDPYDGLDRQSRDNLKGLVEDLAGSGKTVIILSGRREDFPKAMTRLAILDGGQLVYQGKSERGWKIRNAMIQSDASEEKVPYELEEKDRPAPIAMKEVNVSYGDKIILNNISWNVDGGDKWLISGPNGAGKSTLLSLVNGENPKAYGCDITLFGKKKGSGESVWDLKKRLGHVSGDFQMNYRVRSALLDVLLSGYFDSIGLYTQASEQQRAKAREWARFCGLEDKRAVSFESLSFGEKRMTLIARSLIKSPELLILDEPCQGLDDHHRDQVLELCENLGRLKELTMLYVTHSAKNTPACLDKHLELIPCDKGGFTGKLSLS